MRNDFKMIVYKQLTISIKTQNDNKIKVPMVLMVIFNM